MNHDPNLIEIRSRALVVLLLQSGLRAACSKARSVAKNKLSLNAIVSMSDSMLPAYLNLSTLFMRRTLTCVVRLQRSPCQSVSAKACRKTSSVCGWFSAQAVIPECQGALTALFAATVVSHLTPMA